nr:hypothetical protein [uncultured Pedobacter sp.]
MDLKALQKKLNKELVEAIPEGSKHLVTVKVKISTYGTEVSIYGFYYNSKEEWPKYEDAVSLHPKEKYYTLKQAISAFRELLLPTDNKIELNN